MQDFNFDDILDEAVKGTETPKVEVKEKGDTVAFVDNETGEVEEAKVEVVEDKPVVTSTTTNAIQSFTEQMFTNILKETSGTEETFTARDKTIASDIISSIYKAVISNDKIGGWKDVDMVSNNVPNQIKRWAKLGISTQDKLYPDIRKNGKTGKFDLVIRGQYQTIEKMLVKYCTKKIFRFKTDVICVGDEFETDFDFAKGQDIVIKHVFAKDVDRNDLTNIIGAYKIAYVKEDDGSITQLLVQIDKNRIMRAYNSAQTKNVWNTDTRKMVLKTVTWEMWNSEVVRPFMLFPDEIIEDLDIVNESEDVDFKNKDFKYGTIDGAKDDALKKIGTGAKINL